MKNSILDQKHFYNEKAAFSYVESIIWKAGKSCPHCGNTGKHYELKARVGLNKCAECKKEFTVRIGTIFQDSPIPLHKWLQAIFLLASSKKGISSHQLHRTLQVTYKSAWFLSHRIREAMKPSGEIDMMGGEGKVVEADETYIGNKGKQKAGARGWSHKEKVFSLVERGGKVRSHHVQLTNVKTLLPILQGAVKQETILMTDEARQYVKIGKEFKDHGVVVHSRKEYVRGSVHTNTIEVFFSIFKRGMKGVYQHCKSNHLKRYLCEFDFRYNTKDIEDSQRADNIVLGFIGKRLMYRDSIKNNLIINV
jgi:transposase-like protein